MYLLAILGGGEDSRDAPALFKKIVRSSPPPIANQYTEYYTHLVCIPIAAILIHCIRYRILTPEWRGYATPLKL